MSFENTTEIFKHLVQLKKSLNPPICIFDLDSTLFDVSPRSEKILHEFAIEKNRPDLLNIQVNRSDWGLYETLVRFGYQNDTHQDLHIQLKDFWRNKFFSNEYIHFDEPYLGAIHFVQRLESENIQIQYLSGRDVPRMGTGTQEVLAKWGLPHNDNQIHLKPNKSQDDEYFKLNWIKDFKNNNPENEIFLFENEPVNINKIGQEFPDVKIIFMNTTHSRKQSLCVKHTEIFHYTIERE